MALNATSLDEACVRLNAVVTTVYNARDTRDGYSLDTTATALVTLGIGLLLLFVGSRFVLPVAGFSACLVGFVGGFWAYGALVSRDDGCVERLLVASGVALTTLGLLLCCFVKLAYFAIGATVGGLAVHFGFAHVTRFAGMDTQNDLLLGQSAWYWVSLFVGGIAGGIVARCYKKRVMIVGSSVAGAILTVHSARTLLVSVSVKASSAVWFACTIVAVCVGVYAQTRARCGCRASGGHAADD